jgi:HD superfamily phosphohydrolase YqeK
MFGQISDKQLSRTFESYIEYGHPYGDTLDCAFCTRVFPKELEKYHAKYDYNLDSKSYLVVETAIYYVLGGFEANKSWQQRMHDNRMDAIIEFINEHSPEDGLINQFSEDYEAVNCLFTKGCEYAHAISDPGLMSINHDGDIYTKEFSDKFFAEDIRSNDYIYVYEYNPFITELSESSQACHMRSLGADLSVKEGLTGNVYVIPFITNSVDIQSHIDKFITFAASHPQMTFIMGSVGQDVDRYLTFPLFIKALEYDNIYFWKGFIDFYRGIRAAWVHDAIVSLLRCTCRDNIDHVIEYLKQQHFFEAMNDSKKKDESYSHHYWSGGLAQHSYGVYHKALIIATDNDYKVENKSLIIAGILHDICKARHCELNNKIVKRMIHYHGHGGRSIFILNKICNLSLTDEERIAIRYHMHSEIMGDSGSNPDKNVLWKIIYRADKQDAKLNPTNKRNN